jgi:dolichol-phosphate mannosyltransferase
MAIGMLSIVTPAYNEEKNLPLIHDRLKAVMAELDMDWEWIIVDDRSGDGTFEVIKDISALDEHVRGVRLSRNFGSHNALTCGLDLARGEGAVVMAGDGQDPPEVIPQLVEELNKGADVVWAARNPDAHGNLLNRGFPRLYYFIMRKVIGIREMPSDGADFFLIDRKVIEALKKYKDHNMSLLVIITWIGFRQSTITYDRQRRVHGSSGWNLSKKFKLVIDSVVSFSYAPIRLMAFIGGLVALAGFLYTTVLMINYFMGEPTEGWTELMVVILLIGGLQMLMLATLGEYLWRTLEEARRRPRYLIAETTSPIDEKGNTRLSEAGKQTD